MKERTENPNPTLVDGCCKKCPLLPSKPGQQHFNQNVLAAADCASRLKRLIDANIAQLVYKEKDDLSARKVAALFGYLNAEDKSERSRLKKLEQKSDQNKNKVKFKPSDYF